MNTPILKIIGFTALVVLIGIVAAAIFYIAFVAFALSSSDNEVLQHTVTSPDNTISALVIRDDCGATCGCQMRVDLQAGEQYLKEVYRDEEACDALITWQDAEHFEVRSDSGKSIVIDVNLLGLANAKSYQLKATI
jgi:hypothetical protein